MRILGTTGNPALHPVLDTKAFQDEYRRAQKALSDCAKAIADSGAIQEACFTPLRNRKAKVKK